MLMLRSERNKYVRGNSQIMLKIGKRLTCKGRMAKQQLTFRSGRETRGNPLPYRYESVHASFHIYVQTKLRVRTEQTKEILFADLKSIFIERTINNPYSVIDKRRLSIREVILIAYQLRL